MLLLVRHTREDEDEDKGAQSERRNAVLFSLSSCCGLYTDGARAESAFCSGRAFQRGRARGRGNGARACLLCCSGLFVALCVSSLSVVLMIVSTAGSGLRLRLSSRQPNSGREAGGKWAGSGPQRLPSAAAAVLGLTPALGCHRPRARAFPRLLSLCRASRLLPPSRVFSLPLVCLASPFAPSLSPSLTQPCPPAPSPRQ